MQREFFLQTGETHALELEGNLTSGFEWTFSSNNPGIAEIQKEVQAPYPEYPGNPNKVLFTITALAPGVALLRFAFQRPWETGVPPKEELEVRLEVRAPR